MKTLRPAGVVENGMEKHLQKTKINKHEKAHAFSLNLDVFVSLYPTQKNLGPRVFLDKAADEDPGRIHFIVPRFWRKKRMRSEAQRMLLLKTMLALTISETNYRLLVYDAKIRSILKNYLLIS